MFKTYILFFTDHIWNGREIDVDQYNLQGYEKEADAQRKLDKLFNLFKDRYKGNNFEFDERSFTIFDERSVTLDNIRCEIREVNVRSAITPYYVDITFKKKLPNIEVIAESKAEAGKMAIQHVEDHYGKNGREIDIVDVHVHNTFFD